MSFATAYIVNPLAAEIVASNAMVVMLPDDWDDDKRDVFLEAVGAYARSIDPSAAVARFASWIIASMPAVTPELLNDLKIYVDEWAPTP